MDFTHFCVFLNKEYKVYFSFIKGMKILQRIQSLRSLLLRKPSIDVALGRWNIDYDIAKMNTKVDWSNEDHCGPCGQKKIDISKTSEKEIASKIKKED